MLTWDVFSCQAPSPNYLPLLLQCVPWSWPQAKFASASVWELLTSIARRGRDWKFLRFVRQPWFGKRAGRKQEAARLELRGEERRRPADASPPGLEKPPAVDENRPARKAQLYTSFGVRTSSVLAFLGFFSPKPVCLCICIYKSY